MDRITELRQKRAALIQRGRELLDSAAEANRDLTAEEEQEYESILAEADALGRTIKREEEQRERERELAEQELLGESRGGAPDPRLTQGAPEAAGQADELTRRYAAAFESYMRGGMAALDPEQRKTLQLGYVDLRSGEMRGGFGDVELRDQSIGTPGAGGYTVPTTFQRAIEEYLIQAGMIRQVGTNQIVTGSGEDLLVPKLTAHGAANWVGEAGPISATDETFAQATLKSYKAVRLVKVSIELLEDTAVDLEGLLARAIGLSIGVLENAAYLAGDGSGKPTGLLAASGGTSGDATASMTAVTADELITFVHALAVPYRRNARWLMHDTAVAAIRKLKDTTNQYLWQPGLQAGQPDTLLGFRVDIDPDVPAYGTTGTKFALLGDFSGYTIRDVGRNGPRRPESTADIGAFAVRRLDERYADNLQVGFLAYHRTDGLLIDPNAVRHLRHA